MDATGVEPVTKHEHILRYIERLKPGSKISVRKIARDMEVSEGTAYRAIKEAENQGFVSTVERVGTVRVEKQKRHNIDKLTFAEVVNIVDGTVIGGVEGLTKTLNKFVIGAMELQAMMKYIHPGDLLIVGNRTKAHGIGLELGAGVLVTGGFEPSAEAKRLADSKALPIISTSYDTFTVASMINRAIYDRLIKKKIMLVEDISLPQAQLFSLRTSQTAAEYNSLMERSGHSRFPVVDESNRVVGMITSKDVFGTPADQPIDKLMTKNPITVSMQTSVASAAHMMVWEGIELLPVVDTGRKLLAVISRQDVLKGMQVIQKQPQIGETFEDLMWSGFEEERDERGHVVYTGSITPQMTTRLGTVAEGVLATLMTQAAFRAVKRVKKGDLVLDNMSTYFVRPVQIDSDIVIKPDVIELSRKFGKVDVEVYHRELLVCKAMLTAQVIDQA